MLGDVAGDLSGDCKGGLGLWIWDNLLLSGVSGMLSMFSMLGLLTGVAGQRTTCLLRGVKAKEISSLKLGEEHGDFASLSLMMVPPSMSSN